MTSREQPLLPRVAALLAPNQRRQAGGLVLAMALRAVLQLLGVASIAPFLAVVADPSLVSTNPWLHRAWEAGGFSDERSFLVALGLAALAALALANLINALTSWWQLRFVWNVHHTVSQRAFRQYLDRPYAFFVGQPSGRLHQNLLSEVGTAVHGVLLPILDMVSQGLVTLALVGLLVLVDPGLALIVVGVLGGAYFVVYVAIRRRLSRLGHERLESHRLRYQLAADAFDGIKELKVLQRERTFVDELARPSLEFARANANHGATSRLPRFLLETIAFGGILLIVLHYLRQGEGVGRILPVLSLYAFAGYRLLPALQSLFSAVSGIRFHRAALDSLCEDLDLLAPAPVAEATRRDLAFADRIRFEGVGFHYPESETPALSGVTLEIPRRSSLGIAGPSGGGKSTLVDLLVGLYPPTEGSLTVDGVPLDEATIPSWRSRIGYVPQTVFLADDTLARNIAFGVPLDEVDPDAVQRAVQAARLDQLVRDLPDGLQTRIGDRGVRLSGGQRQRIGIARAVYHNPEILILDEATNALDEATEASVLEAIRDLTDRRTLVLVAHRPSTLVGCDRVVVIDDGAIGREGSWGEVVGGETGGLD